MPSSPRHPHLLFSAERLEEIRKKTTHPRYRRDWEHVRFQAEADLSGEMLEEDGSALPLAGATVRLNRLAFAYRISGERHFFDRSRQFLEMIQDTPIWTDQENGGFYCLHEARLSHNLAQAYDLLAEELPEAQRRALVETCRKRLIEVFCANCRYPGNTYLYGLRTMNILGVPASGATSLCLALHGDGVDLTKEIEIARSHLLRFIEWYDSAGASLEIDGYWTYANHNVLRALVALRENGWDQIFDQRAMKLNRIAYPPLCMSIGGKFVTNFTDSFYGHFLHFRCEKTDMKKSVRQRLLAPGADERLASSGTRSCVLILAAAFQDPRLQWFAEQMPPGDELSIICGDPDLPAQPPHDLPTTAVYHGAGVAVMRSSMTDPQTLLLGLKAGRARGHVYDDPHCQFDLNSVVLDAYGTTLLADPGYHHLFNTSMSTIDPNHISNASPKHNTLLVDGEGQTHVDSPIAHLQDLSPNDEIDYVVSRMERGYGARVQRFDRHAYLVEKRIFVLLDDIELAQPAVLGWNFHGAEAARLEPGTPAVIECEGAVLRIVPFGAAVLNCQLGSGHLLPHLNFSTSTKVPGGRFGWILLVDPAGAKRTAASAQVDSSSITLRWNERVWNLPVVGRRNSFVSDIMLPFRERPGKLRKLS